ncbi:unnamed protein product [Parascedosporium putredinis]|uniref:Uncharacterized protein n=1 Tax=Parascedosporium putredinis TaxID=1442378 RepID=A0A9P1MDN7_9PEZI|nr:unnamed protein product [Parascedosporium putredinis]CAI8002985.1 unnamed protein product [Parascedosporium putredinis]
MASLGSSVNRPTNVKVRDENIESKLQLYAIYSAFKAGKVPSNEQIDITLNSFLESKALKSPSGKLSTEGQALVADAREVVRLAKYLFLSKNEGNLLQDFIWETEQFKPSAISTPGAPVDKATAQQHGDQALQGLRTVGTLLITNGQFRKLLKDFTVLFRDVAGDAASNVAGRVRPSEDQLNQVDMPAQDHTWHEKPDFSKDTLREKARGTYGGKPKEDLKDTAAAAANAANPTGSTRPGDVNAQAGASTGRSRKVKQRNDEYRRRTREYFNQKIPQERKEQTIWRLKKMVLECQQHPDYSRAVETILDLAGEYGRHGRTVAQGGTGTRPLWNSIQSLYDAAQRDDELRNWFSRMDSYIRRCLLQEGYILDESSNQEWDQLYDHGRYLLRDKYRPNTDRIINETKFLSDQFDKDAQNKEFGLAVQRLFQHLGNDENGKPTFKPHLIKDLTEVIIPSAVDAVIENLIIEADNIFPNNIELKSNHYFKMGRKKISNDQHQVFDVRVGGIQMDLRDVNYYIHRKTGFPSVKDTGVANIFLGGTGLTFELAVSTPKKHDRQRFFKVDNVDVDIRNLKVKLVKSKYKLVFSLLQSILLKVMRPAIQKVVEKSIKDQFSKWDKIMYEIQKDAKTTLEDERARIESEEGGKKSNMYSRYLNSAKKYKNQKKAEAKTEAQRKAAQATAGKKFNIAYTMHDSIFPDIKLSDATSTRATKYKDMALQGEKWESPVFSIGHASTSKDIPRAPKIEEKLDQKRIHEQSKFQEEERLRNLQSQQQQQPGVGNLAYTQPGAGALYSQQQQQQQQQQQPGLGAYGQPLGAGNLAQQPGAGGYGEYPTGATDRGNQVIGSAPLGNVGNIEKERLGTGNGNGNGVGHGHGHGNGLAGNGYGNFQEKVGEFGTGLKIDPNSNCNTGAQYENGNAGLRQTAEFPGTGGTTAPVANPQINRIY